MRIESFEIPGVGKRYEFHTRHGDVFVLIERLDGKKELSILKDDEVVATVELDSEEANQLALILAPSFITDFLDKKIDVIFKNIAIDSFEIRKGFFAVGKSLKELQLRNKTGASIISIMRKGEIITNPPPDTVIMEGDIVVMIGNKEEVEKAQKYLATGNL